MAEISPRMARAIPLLSLNVAYRLMAALPTPPNNTPIKSHRRGYSLMVTFLPGVKDFDEMVFS
jgi:hypothetical protein